MKEDAVRGFKIMAVAAALILAGITGPTFADSPVPAPDSAAVAAAVADTSSTVGAEGPSRAASSLADSAPSASSLALLRTRVGRHLVRVSVGEDDYKLSRARFEPSGVVFKPGGSEGMSLWAGEGESPVSSPIAWERIDCIRVQRSHAVLGAVTGALLGSWLVINAANHSNYDQMEGALFTVISAPLIGIGGASVGALLGVTLFATWPIVWRPGLAESPVPAGDAAGAADASSLRTPAAAPPAAPRTPSPAEIATLSERVDHHVARIHLGGNAYEIRGARFESGGFAFSAGDLRGVPAWDNGGPNDDFTQPAPLASPISWDRIDKIEVRKPCGTRGALAGGLIGTAASAAILGVAGYSDYDLELGVIGLFVLPPLGVVIGSAIGAAGRRSEVVWPRDGDRAPSPPPSPR